MVLGKLLVPGRPTNLDYSRARAQCACSRCGWGLFGHFFSRLSFLFSEKRTDRREKTFFLSSIISLFRKEN